MALFIISPTQGFRNSKRAMNIVVLSEGFLVSRLDVFLAEVRRFDAELRKTSPFHRFPTLITVSALFAPSLVSIANITDATRCDWRKPNAAGQVPPDDAPSPFDTPFGALYCRGRDTTASRAPLPRILLGDAAKVAAAIAAEPFLAGLETTALVLVDNTQADGGAADNHVAWFSMLRGWEKVAIHELGHSAFDLADEYDNDGPPRHSTVEPNEFNVTTRTTRDQLRIFWNTGPTKFSLIRWHELMDPATPAPSSRPNGECTPLSIPDSQLPMPDVTAQTVGLFEGAHYSPCAVFRPRLDCRMRHRRADFCPICEWSIQSRLSRVDDPFRVNTRATVPGSWTIFTFYFEDPSRLLVGLDLGMFVFYAGTTGDYQVHKATGLVDPVPAPRSAPGVRIDPFWTSLSAFDILGLPHFLAHSLPLGRLAIYEVVDDAGKPRLDLRFDSGNNAVPWTHVTTFLSRGVPHMVAYQSSTGRIEISRLIGNNVAPDPVSSTALDPNNLWLPGYTIITTFTVDGVPHVLKHNASTGVVHVQSLDPPGTGPNTFISGDGHWSPGATAAVAYEHEGRTYVYRTSLTNYEALDWVWPAGAGVEVQLRKQSLDVTLAFVVVRGKDSRGLTPNGLFEVAAINVVGGGVRMMIVR
jgi:hypothetical protein